MEEILAGLNEAQKKALTTTEGYIRVIAEPVPARRGRWRHDLPIWWKQSAFCLGISCV